MRKWPQKGPKAAAKRLLAGIGVVFCLLGALSCPVGTAASDRAAEALERLLLGEALKVRARLDPALWSEGTLARVYDGPNGASAVVSTDLETACRLREAIADPLSEALSKLEGRAVAVPLGSLTGVGLLEGRGVSLPVRLESAEGVSAEPVWRAETGSTGQTVLLLDAVITVPVTLHAPGGRQERVLEVRLPLTEYLFLGQLPEGYFSSS